MSVTQRRSDIKTLLYPSHDTSSKSVFPVSLHGLRSSLPLEAEQDCLQHLKARSQTLRETVQ